MMCYTIRIGKAGEKAGRSSEGSVPMVFLPSEGTDRLLDSDLHRILDPVGEDHLPPRGDHAVVKEPPRVRARPRLKVH